MTPVTSRETTSGLNVGHSFFFLLKKFEPVPVLDTARGGAPLGVIIRGWRRVE